MLAALFSFPPKLRSQKAREFARRSHVARMANAAGNERFEEQIWRAKHDMRGEVIHHGVTYSAAHPDGQQWAIVRSKAGAVNQVDLHLGSELFATCGLRKLERAMKRAKL
jgi:hypothetical protein